MLLGFEDFQLEGDCSFDNVSIYEVAPREYFGFTLTVEKIFNLKRIYGGNVSEQNMNLSFWDLFLRS